MRLAIKTIVATAAITATATVVQHDADAAFPSLSLQPIALTSPQQDVVAAFPALPMQPTALTYLQQDVSAAFPALPLQPATFSYRWQFTSDGDGLPAAMYGYSPQLMAYDYSPLPGPYLVPSQLSQSGPFAGANAFNPSTEPLQPVALAPPEKPVASKSSAEPLLRVALAQPQEPVAFNSSTESLQRVDFAQPQEPVTSNSSTEPPQRLALAQPEEPVSPAPKRDPDQAPKRRASLEPSGHIVLPPAAQLMSPIVRIQFNVPTLAPMKHTFFCLKYPGECKVHKTVFRGGPVRLTAQRWAELVRVNAAINRAIAPQPNTHGLAGEKWLISPKSGECHDYAVTKRHELHALGWPERDLLLSEVVTAWGEHHLVLVIRTSDGDFVADNLNPNIRRWSKTPYQWVRIQSPGNPSIWSTVASTTVWAKDSGLANREL